MSKAGMITSRTRKPIKTPTKVSGRFAAWRLALLARLGNWIIRIK